MAAGTGSSRLKPLLNKTCNKKGPVSRPLLSLRFTSLAAARPTQAIARHAPDLVLVEAERHQFTHRLLRLGERGGHCDVEVEALGHLRPGRELRTAHGGVAARGHIAELVAVAGDLLEEIVASDQQHHG